MAERAGSGGTVILDVDSTLVAIEGIDWLAALRGPEVAERIAAATTEAMEGRIGLEQVYEARLAAVAPTRDEIAALGEAYVAHLAAGAAELVRELRTAGRRAVIVSAGIRGALLPLAAHLGIPAADVHGVEVSHHADGTYRDFDRATPLTRSRGKAALVAGLGLPAPIVAVGDGASDLEIATELPSVSFIAFTGFVRRPRVADHASVQAESFAQLRHLLRPAPSPP